jgi:hypothetical protein
MDMREPREGKKSCFEDHVRHCAARKYTIHVSLLDARDWSEKRGADRSNFSSGRLMQPLQKMIFFIAAA